ncbi:MAG: TIGR04290 family methyltransferase [Candidatus Latescibacterota bacterium]
MVETLETRLSNPRNEMEWKITELGPWFHNLHLPEGVQTAPEHPLGDFPAFKWQHIAPLLPEVLTGWTVLDIGCNAGFYSFELARRGARVMGIDFDEHYLRQARWAADVLGLADSIQFVRMQIYDLMHTNDRYDIVLFLGVFYHLRYPLLAMDIVAPKVKRFMVFQTLTMPGEEVLDTEDDLGINSRERMLEPGWPKMAFIEKRLAGDPTNWWAPNHAAVEAVLRSAGFNVLERIAHEMYLCRPEAVDPYQIAELKREELYSATGGNASR